MVSTQNIITSILHTGYKWPNTIFATQTSAVWWPWQHAPDHGAGRDLREDGDDRQPPVLCPLQRGRLQQGALQQSRLQVR